MWELEEWGELLWGLFCCYVHGLIVMAVVFQLPIDVFGKTHPHQIHLRKILRQRCPIKIRSNKRRHRLQILKTRLSNRLLFSLLNGLELFLLIDER